MCIYAGINTIKNSECNFTNYKNAFTEKIYNYFYLKATSYCTNAPLTSKLYT